MIIFIEASSDWELKGILKLWVVTPQIIILLNLWITDFLFLHSRSKIVKTYISLDIIFKLIAIVLIYYTTIVEEWAESFNYLLVMQSILMVSTLLLGVLIMKQEGKNLPISKYLLSEKDINLLKNYVKQHKDKIGKLIYINPKTNNNIILKVALIIEHSYVLLVMIYIVLPTLMQHFPNYKLLFAVIGFIGLLGYLKLSYQRLVWLTNEQKKARNRFLIETSSLLLGVALLYYSNLLFFSMFSLYPTIYINRMITIKFVEVLDN